MGVCGKTQEIEELQDLLIYQVKGRSCYAKEIVEKDENVDKSIVSFIQNLLFTTLTNVNLDPDIRSLRQTIIYGLKGISAYGHQARELG